MKFGARICFAAVCHSVHKGGGYLCSSMLHMSHDQGISVQKGPLSRGLCLGDLCPGVSSQGVSIWGSLSGDDLFSGLSLSRVVHNQ